MPAQKGKSTHQPPLITVLADHPIADPHYNEPDSFSLESRVGAAYDILRHRLTQTPITIALYGGWGTGKSSSMRWLQKELEEWSALSDGDRKGHFRLRTIWFEPWKFEKREDVWRGLISEVIIAAIDIKNASLKTVTTAAKRFGLFLGRSFLNTISSAKIGAEAGVAKAEIDLEALRHIAEDYERTNHPEKAYLNEFESSLKDWVNQSLGEGQRMVIFIDDLDRCLPDVALEVLEALKLYLGIPQLAFVVGLDRSVVDAVIRKKYAKMGIAEEKAEQYLDKLFQVEINIAPSEADVSDYVKKQILALDEVTEKQWSTLLNDSGKDHKSIIEKAIEKQCRGNPREVKRLLNSTLLQAHACYRRKKEGQPSEENKVLQFAQGAAFYLIYRELQSSCGLDRANEIIHKKDSLEFFEFWSKNLDVLETLMREPRDEPEDIRGTRKDPKPKKLSEQDEKDPEKENLRKSFVRMCPEDRESNRLELEKYDAFWELLRIPFDPGIATMVATPKSSVETAPKIARSKSSEETSKEAPLPEFIKRAVARDLGLPVDQINSEHLEKLKKLDLRNSELEDLSVLSKLSNLIDLDLSGTQVSDILELSSLSNLAYLGLSRTQVSDISALSELSNLAVLDLSGTRVNDISDLISLSNLCYLCLIDTQVSDISVISKLSNLTHLYLSGIQVSDIAALSDLSNLTDLDLSGTPVSDISVLSELSDLYYLDLSRTQVSNISVLSKLDNITDLYMGGTEVTDISALSELSNLENLDLSGTQVSDISVLSRLSNLDELYLSISQIPEEQIREFKASHPNCDIDYVD